MSEEIMKEKSANKINSKSLYKQYKPNDPYLCHLERIKNMESKTDNTAPSFLITTFCPVSKFLSDNNRLVSIMKENVTLLGRLNDIARSNSIYHETKDNSCKVTNVSRFQYKLSVLDRIEKDNFTLGTRIATCAGEIPSVKALNKSWQFHLRDIRFRCQHKLILPELMEKPKYLYVEKNQPMVYLDIGERNSRPLGRIIILLYLDLAPITVKNFIDLCENHRNWPNPNTTNSYYINDIEDRCSCSIKEETNISTKTYEYISKDCQLIGTKFTRIFPNLFIHGGNLKVNKNPNFRGIPDYEPEKFQFHHGYKGTLSMCPMENGLINSEFTISLKPLHMLDDKRLAFGRVINGISILDTVSSYGTKNGKPQKHVEILDCGILNLNLE